MLAMKLVINLFLVSKTFYWLKYQHWNIFKKSVYNKKELETFLNISIEDSHNLIRQL